MQVKSPVIQADEVSCLLFSLWAKFLLISSLQKMDKIRVCLFFMKTCIDRRLSVMGARKE